MNRIVVIGAGLAGSEAAYQLASRNIPVTLIEMRPNVTTPAHRTAMPAELVCSNSLGSSSFKTASGLLKAELAMLGSMILRVAVRSQVPAGSALAVDREMFSYHVESQLKSLQSCEYLHQHVTAIPKENHSIIATGPLTSDPLAEDLAKIIGKENLAFYDATSPIIEGESIDRTKFFYGSRRDENSTDYINCPMDQNQYSQFVSRLRNSPTVTPHDFEQCGLFSGCQPIEDLAKSGELTLAFGPMRPVGLMDPRTGKKPFAVVQLRKEDTEGKRYGMVGFQTRMTFPAQREVFSTIPGLENAVFLRLGVIHRNTFVCGPVALDCKLRLKNLNSVRLAGQITGVEGYLESTACGLMSGLFSLAESQRSELSIPPTTTMIGSLMKYVIEGPTDNFQPMNANFGLLPNIEKHSCKRERKQLYFQRSLTDLKTWIDSAPFKIEPISEFANT